MRTLWGLMVLVAVSGCSVVVDEIAADLPEAETEPDAGPTGPACRRTSDCLNISGREFDCMQVCVIPDGATMGQCLAGTTPAGISCGPEGSLEICISGSCQTPRCGDGYIDRFADPPEHCDDGDDNDLNLCNNSCTRRCTGGATPNCHLDDGNDDPCSGTETCNTVSGLCEATRATEDGTSCMVGDNAGVCEAARCVF